MIHLRIRRARHSLLCDTSKYGTMVMIIVSVDESHRANVQSIVARFHI
jgi:hypothetical protein